MPSKSASQHRLMAAVAHNPSFAKKVGIPQSVGRDFTEADKGRKFAKGGDMAKKLPPFMGKETKAEEAKEMKVKRMSPALYKKGEKAEGVHGKSGMEKPTKYAKGGFTSAADGVATKGRTKAQRFAGGGDVGYYMEADQNFAEANQRAPQGGALSQFTNRLMGRAAPNRMVSPSMTPDGGASLANAIKSLGGRPATPEEIAKMNSTMSSLGMSRPQFNPADADKLRAQMQSRMAAQSMRLPVARPVMGASARPMSPKFDGVAKTFAKGGSIDGCAAKGKTKCKYI